MALDKIINTETWKSEKVSFTEGLFYFSIGPVVGLMTAALLAAVYGLSHDFSDKAQPQKVSSQVEQSATPNARSADNVSTPPSNLTNLVEQYAPKDPVPVPPTSVPKPAATSSPPPANPPKPVANDPQSDRLREIALNYLAQPAFTSTNFSEQLTGTAAELKRWNLDEGMAYFSIPTDQYYATTLPQLSVRPETVEFGQRTERGLELGNYVYTKSGTHFFRIPVGNFKVDPQRTIKTNFGGVEYEITLSELADYLENENTYGGCVSVQVGTTPQGYPIRFSDHGPFVAKKGEPSLEKLVGKLTAGLVTNEEKAQRLLDFVTQQVKYNPAEASTHKETLKRPNEVLMTGNADCSGKVTLYASLLEQAGIDYRLVYNQEHISVMVEGIFFNFNQSTLSLGGKNYSLTETVIPGFRIGLSFPTDTDGIPYTMDRFLYFQKPGEPVYDIKTGEKLPCWGKR